MVLSKQFMHNFNVNLNVNHVTTAIYCTLDIFVTVNLASGLLTLK